MSLARRSSVVCLTLGLLAASGCARIKSWFPDKERDYQFHSEIPELIVPEDLKQRNFISKTPSPRPPAAPEAAAEPVTAPRSKAPAKPVAEGAAAAKPALAAIPEKPAVNEKPAASEKTAFPEKPKFAELPADTAKPAKTEKAPAQVNKPTAPLVSVVKSDVSSLQIDQSQKQAWHLVSRALSLQKIEIAERNLDKGYFKVRYDPDEVKPTYRTMWDELRFMWGDDETHELEYLVSIKATAPQATEVMVLDPEGKVLSNAPATRLLKLITDGINQDLSPEPNEGAKPKEPVD